MFPIFRDFCDHKKKKTKNTKANTRDNLKLAFEVAEKHLGIPQLLDLEDLEVVKPDEVIHE